MHKGAMISDEVARIIARETAHQVQCTDRDYIRFSEVSRKGFPSDWDKLIEDIKREVRYFSVISQKTSHYIHKLNALKEWAERKKECP